jgi:hypothetical protein
MIVRYKHQIEGLLAFLVLVFIGVQFFQFWSQLSIHHHPVWSDEFFYFVNAQASFQNNTLQAAFTFNGEGSTVFGADAHGFAYPLINAVFAKIFGWHFLNFIYLNHLLLVAAIFVIGNLKTITKIQRLLTICLIGLFPFFALYAFTFMQEIIHLFFAVLLSVIVYNIHTKSLNYRNFIYFVAVVLVASLFRTLWLFWLIGLIPFAKNKRQKALCYSVFFIGIALSFLMNKIFLEAVPNYFYSLIELISNGNLVNVLSSLIHHTLLNLKHYFFSYNKSAVYFLMKAIPLALVGYFVYLAISKKIALYKSLALIGLTNYLLLFLVYDAFDWREIRTMSPLYYFFVLFIVIEFKKTLQFVIAAVLFACFVLSVKISKQWIQERNVAHKLTPNELQDYNAIALKIPKNKVVLLKHFVENETWKLLYLPIQNQYKEAIKYILPYYKINSIHFNYILYQPKFKTPFEKIIDSESFLLVKYKQ